MVASASPHPPDMQPLASDKRLTVTQTWGTSTADDEPLSPGLAEALAAIALAEQADQCQWGAVTSAASTIHCTASTNTATSAQIYPSIISIYSASSVENHADNEAWQSPPRLLCQQPQHSQLAGHATHQQPQHTQLAGHAKHQQPQHRQLAGHAKHQQPQHRQQQQDPNSNSRYGKSCDLFPAEPSSAVLSALDTSVSLWQQFACEFAASASAAGDLEAAAGATDFGEQIAAGFLMSDDATAAALAAVVEQAEHAGLSRMEVIAAQQKALMLEAEAAASAAAAATLSQGWAKAAAKQTSSQLLPGSGSTFTSAQPNQQWQHASSATSSALEPERDFRGRDFPALTGNNRSSPSQQKSPHSIPRQWKGGRVGPQPRGIRVINSSSGSSSSSRSTLRPSSSDVLWDLALDGLRLKEDVELPLELQCALADAEAADATRWLVEKQAAEAARRGGNTDRLSQNTVRSMMEKTAAAAAKPGSGPDNSSESALAGSRHCGRDFRQMWAYMFSTGWLPVPKREGGGGTHYKFRRTLPVSGIVQTLVHASSPSDSQRGQRNAAASIARLDRQAKELEDEARAAIAAAAGAAGSTTPARVCSTKGR